MSSHSLLARCSLFVASLLTLAAMPAAGQRTDVIRGRVIAADSTPLRNAVVTAMDTAAKVPKPTRTDSAGAYSISFENGGGTYMVAVTMLGHAPQRRVVSRAADGTMPRADFKMTPVAAQLGAVRSVGERPKAPRSDFAGDFSTGGTTSYQSLSGGLSGDVTGDLSAILATLPGISVTPSVDGTLNVSAFGIGSDQNGLVLNGINFGAQVPRDGFRLAVISASYDPGRGGFAGVQQSLRMSPGTNTISRSTHITLDAPALQWTSDVSSNLGTEYGQQIASGSIAGPIAVDKAFYSTAYQFSRRASTLPSLESANPASLAALHMSADSVRRLLGLLGTAGIPVRTSRVPNGRENTSGSLAFRFDFEPNVPPSQPGLLIQNTATIDDYYLEFGGTFRKNGGAMIGATSVPSSGGELTHRDGWAQFTAAKYLPRNTLNETTVSVGGAEDKNDPYLDLPSATLLLASGLGDGVGLSMARVGGSASPRNTSQTWSTGFRNVTTYNTWDRHHSVALTLDATFDGYSSKQDTGAGNFVFNSLADFENGTPASFSRTLTGLHTSGTGFNGAIGIGDTYNPVTPGTIQFGQIPPSKPVVQYGLRLETNRFGVTPAYNPKVESAFGVRTDRVPNGTRVMPMIGFNWPVLGPMKLNGIPFGRRASISGGVREYRGTLSTRALDAYTRQTGLPSAIQQLYCVGDATPLPDWRAFEQSSSAIPTECGNGAISTPFAQSAPPVTLFAPNYTFYESWRPALNLNYTISSKFRLGANGTWAINRNNVSNYDLNFAPNSRFALAAEGDRPVYVSSASIVPSTGAAAFSDSRVSPDFAHVNEARSDLRSQVRSLGLTLGYSPGFIFIGGPNAVFMNASLSYTYNDAREQFRGFQSAAGDPRVVTWSRGSIARHVITLNLNRSQGTFGNIGLQARIQSGTPFTPDVAGDINGDGYSNDRAYVFNPAAATTDTGAARAMTRLLQSAPSNVRTCLDRQLGRIAGRNSCVGPWAMPQLNMTFSPDPYRLGFKNRGSVTLIVTNILSGLDQALHGSNRLHGWGQQAFSDPTLLTVRGFDPASQRFAYTVNPLFGSTSQFRNTFRSPFMLTLDFRLEVGPDRETQYLEALLRPRASEGPALTLDQIKNRIARAFNPIDQLLQQKDSIKLTDTQVDSMKRISRSYSVRRDSIATAMARYLMDRRGEYGGEDVRKRWHAAGVDSYAGYLADVRAVVALFTPEQMELAKTKPSFFGFVNLANFKEADISRLFRGAMASLP
ncbi:MAG TPA: carboxypeptidase-like regulatory domain-containing protein [Gemmatimonadaceae bacterium]|nr:carboxypeptidase-like regulatory domain-containing protein [Gemmatimonadaceae bacterium]